MWNVWVGRAVSKATAVSEFLVNSSKTRLYNTVLAFKVKPLQSRSQPSLNKMPLDKLTTVQLQTENCSLQHIKLPPHFPWSYSQHSLIKAITQNREEHLVQHTESNSPRCIGGIGSFLHRVNDMFCIGVYFVICPLYWFRVTFFSPLRIQYIFP